MRKCPTTTWMQAEAQMSHEDDEDVEAAGCHLSVSASSQVVVRKKS